jgi:hypothetical protein
MSEVIYHCSVCRKEAKAEEGKPIPLCCQKEMEPLPYCTLAQTAEMSRSADADEPCDNGTGRRKRD